MDRRSIAYITILVALIALLAILAGIARADVVSTDLKPDTDDSLDLGTSSYQWQDLYLSGTTYFDGTATSAYAQTVLDDTTGAIMQKTLGLFHNCTLMTRTGNDTWVVYHNGAAVDISSSTTDGLQEAIDNMAADDTPLYVFGGGRGATAGDVSVITCTTTVAFPPMEMRKIVMDGVTISHGSGIGSSPGVTFDSCMMVDFRLCGQVAYGGAGKAVHFKAETVLDVDAITAITDSSFFIGAVASDGTHAIYIDPDSGSIVRNIFTLNEVNCSGTYGLSLFSGGTYAVRRNTFRIGGLHNMTAAALQVGTNTNATSTVTGNIFHIGGIMPADTDAFGVEVYGLSNHVDFAIDATEDGFKYGLNLHSCADNGYYNMRACDSETTAEVNMPTGSVDNIIIVKGQFYGAVDMTEGDLSIIDSAGDNYLYFLVPNGSASTIVFGDAADPDVGSISWRNADNSLRFETADVERFQMQADGDLTATGNFLGDNLYTTTVDINATEIKALAATQKQLVAAPGANAYLEFVSATLIFDCNTTTNYSDASGDGNLVIKFVDGDGAAVSQDIEADAFIDATADAITNAIPKKDAIVAASACVNKALVLDNDGDEFTTGTGVLQVIITYRTWESLGL